VPAKHRRINVSFKPKTVQALTLLSRKMETSLSHVAQELVEEALELREDIYLSKLAEESEKRAKGKLSVSADKLWKDLHRKAARKMMRMIK
jgi:predicted DNA-binding protein